MRIVLVISALALVADAQVFSSDVSFTSTTGLANTCRKQADCCVNQRCQMPDHWNYPLIWPPCPHVGTCVCIDNYVLAPNGTCVGRVNLSLRQACTGNIWEVIRFDQRCQGGIVICNEPAYIERTNQCVPAPVPTFQPVPYVPPVIIQPTVRCNTVSWSQACDGTTNCCDGSRGLSCQQRGPTTQYNQCLCSDRYSVFDQRIGACRSRIYGDLCTENEDCNSGLISNTGFECRYGRCRCSKGFEPYDNLFWNHTSSTTYTRRICISENAVSWAPTGTACTVHPHQFADSATTRVCHSRAFCHLCWSQRTGFTGIDTARYAVVGTTYNAQGYYNYAWAESDRTNTWSGDNSTRVVVNTNIDGATTVDATTSYVAAVGVCREMTCGQDGQCGFQGQCNRFQGLVDPPCERGVCDCQNGNGFWKDRFSRCAPMRQLWLGDRCIPNNNGLHMWYVNNENWDSDKECVLDGDIGGYAGYTWGTIKCKLPLIEDKDGNCVRNDDKNGILFNIVGYNQACDEQDYRIPRRICDITKGLTCVSKVCTCAQTSTCSSSYAGCEARSSSGSLFWDGNTCRARQFGDRCTNEQDCCGGSCIQGSCGCPSGLRAVGINTASITQGGDEPTTGAITTTQFCFRNVTVVGKGQECHLNPAQWSCTNLLYGCQNPVSTFINTVVNTNSNWNTWNGNNNNNNWNSWNNNNNNNFAPVSTGNYMLPKVCDRGLVCMRCPADYNADDEELGTCRAIIPQRVPDGSCSQGDLTQATMYGGRSVGGLLLRGAASSIRFDALFAVLLLAIAKLF